MAGNKKLSSIVTSKRKLAGYTIKEMADFLKVGLSSYQRREMLGKFSSKELEIVARKLKLDFEDLQKIAEDPTVGLDELADGVRVMTEFIIKGNCMLETLLKVGAELLSDKRTRNNEKNAVKSPEQILGYLTEDVNKRVIRLLSELE
jgi:hypothetical protein